MAKSALASDEERQVADRLLYEDMRYDPNRPALPAHDDDPELDADNQGGRERRRSTVTTKIAKPIHVARDQVSAARALIELCGHQER